MKASLKKWFSFKKEQELREYNIVGYIGECEIIGETDKAYKLDAEIITVTGGEFHRVIWAPKSCVEVA